MKNCLKSKLTEKPSVKVSLQWERSASIWNHPRKVVELFFLKKIRVANTLSTSNALSSIVVNSTMITWSNMWGWASWDDADSHAPVDRVSSQSADQASRSLEENLKKITWKADNSWRGPWGRRSNHKGRERERNFSGSVWLRKSFII